MGVLNVTPDSFSDGGRFVEPRLAVARGCQLAAEGADIIDVGGESTRPYSSAVSVGEEISRTVGVIAELARRLPGQMISIDTSKAEVARQAVAAGAAIINDVSALTADPEMVNVAAETGAHVVLMHMQGTPADMQVAPTYGDVVEEVLAYLSERVEFARAHGIGRDRLMVDPGIGFGKSAWHNLALIRNIGRFRELGCRVLVGPSRKGFLGAVCGSPVGERDCVSAACVALLVLGGADAVRVHDVRRAAEAALLAEAVAANHEAEPSRC
jgi:dihydropteroate synthase